MNKQPLMRAAVTQDVLNQMTLEECEAVRSAAPKEYATVVETSGFEFIPLATDMAIARAIWKLYGGDKCTSMTRAGTFKTLSNPFLRPIVSGALAWFGPSPGSLLKAYSKTVPATMRNVGKFKPVEVNDNQLDLEWTHVPDIVYDNDVWIDTFVASFESVFDYCGVKGKGLAKYLDRRSQSATLSFTWEDPSS